MNPQLAISRRQFPLAPAFASTAHSAQGQTIRQGVIADLCIGANGNPFTSYVALTRVQSRQRLLIYRPFAAAPFQRGIGIGRELLKEKACSECKERKGVKAYTNGQWKRTNEARVCKECTWRHTQEGCPWQCSVCSTWGPEEAFPGMWQQNRARSSFRVCAACKERKACGRCGKTQTEEHFSKRAWKARHVDRRVCHECCRRTWQSWTCAACSERKPKEEFKRESRRHPGRPHGRQVCDACVFQRVMLGIARAARKRLRRRRNSLKAERLAPVIAELKKEIAALSRKRRAERDDEGTTAAAPTTTPSPLPEQSAGQDPTVAKRNIYTCPFCNTIVASKVYSGMIDHRNVCGHQFRVENGTMARTQHNHVCPHCGTIVTSSKASGRVRSEHRTPKGKMCPQKEWVVKS